MNKKKIIIAFLLSLSIACSVGFYTACNNNDTPPTDIQNPDGKPDDGKPDDGKPDDGKPDDKPDDEVKTATYSVTVKYASDNEPARDLRVLIYDDATNKAIKRIATDSNGKIEVELDKGNYTAKVMPADLTSDDTASEAKLTADKTSENILISESVEKHSYYLYVMYEDEKPVEGVEAQLCVAGTVEGNCYNATTDSNGCAVIRLPSSVAYDIHAFNIPEGYYQEMKYKQTQPNIYSYDIILKEVPDSVPTESQSGLKSFALSAIHPVKVTIPAGEQSVYTYFKPIVGKDDAGRDIYSGGTFLFEDITGGSLHTSADLMTGDVTYTVSITYYSGCPIVQSENQKGGFSLYYTIESIDQNELSYYCWTLKVNLDKPAETDTEIVIKVTKTDNYTPVIYREEEVKATETFKGGKFADGKGEYLEMDKQANRTVVYNPTDRFYHVGDQNGPVLCAKIGRASLYFDQSFASIDQGMNCIFVDSENLVRYNYVTANFVNTYVGYCNSDGVVGVTEELKLFLQRYCNTHSSVLDTNIADGSPDEWLIFCGYYNYNPNKPTQGNGIQSDPFIVTNGYYEITLNEGEKAYFTFASLDERGGAYTVKTTENVNFALNGNTVGKVVSVDFTAEAPVLEVTANEKMTLVLYVDITSGSKFAYFNIDDDIVSTASENNPQYYTYTVDDDGKYSLSAATKNEMGYAPTSATYSYEVIRDGKVVYSGLCTNQSKANVFELKAGDEVIVVSYSSNWIPVIENYSAEA